MRGFAGALIGDVADTRSRLEDLPHSPALNVDQAARFLITLHHGLPSGLVPVLDDAAGTPLGPEHGGAGVPRGTGMGRRRMIWTCPMAGTNQVRQAENRVEGT
jgi:hypothetical protein